MPHCSAYNCNNKSDNNASISYHRLPGPNRKLIRQAWIDAIGRTNLPKTTYLCANHFTEECFDPSHDLKQRLLPEGSRLKRVLLPDAVPTIFQHRDVQSPRISTQVRTKRKEQRELISQLLTDTRDECIEDVSRDVDNQVTCSLTNEIGTQTEVTFPSGFLYSSHQKHVSTQSHSYVADANTSTLDLRLRTQKSINIQVIPKTKSKAIQFPSKKLKKKKEKWRTVFKAYGSRDEESSGEWESDDESDVDKDDNDGFEDDDGDDVVSDDNGSDKEVGAEWDGESVYVDDGSDLLEGDVNNELIDEGGVAVNIEGGGDLLGRGVNNELLNIVNTESNYIELNDSFISVEEGCVDDERDESFSPSSVESGQDDSSNDDSDDEVQSKKDERTLFVYEKNLYELLHYCPKCGAHIDQSLIEEVPNTGSQLHLKITCFNNCDVEWRSQPTVGKLKGLGNLFLASSIAFSGIPFAKFQRFAYLVNLKFISDSLYYQLRKEYIFPVVRQKWSKERKRMISLLKKRDLVVMVGDGRCDSPGHSAKYCTYTFIETETGQVVDTIVVPVTEVANSNAMEKEGFIRILSGLKDEGVKIDIISTDRHTQIRKLMRVDPRFSSIKHQFDPWHLAKSICKKLNKAAKKKSREALLEWVPSIVNHFWWSVSTCDKNHQILYEKFSSVMYHVVNKHEWGGCKYFKKCAHATLTKEQEKERKWLVEGSDAHTTLVSLVKDKTFKNDCQYLTELIHTTNVEVFNNVILKYIPKQYHFEHDHMVMGSYLAALDNNFNSERRQEKVQSGENIGKYKYKIAWRKATKKLIARKVYQKKSYENFKVMMKSVSKRAAKGNKNRKSRKRIMAPSERDDRDVIIERTKKMSRFS